MPPAVVAPAAPVAADPRTAAYCRPDGPEVFSGIVHGNQIWTPDPFDVEEVHADAREAFARLLGRASDDVPPPHGKSLLLLGEAGSGKTHLMRAFRTAAHAAGTGYCGYLQMLSRSDSYPRYVLSYLIDALEQPYRPADPTTGLARLARGLFDAVAPAGDPDCDRLCDDTLDPDEAARIVFRFADLAVQDARFAGIDINLLRAVLFLLPNDGRIRPKVLNWLRCEELPRYDREALGDLPSRSGPEMPLKTIVGLGALMRAVHSAALVLLVDQLDEMIELGKGDAQPGEQFRSAVNALIDITEALPNAVVVIGCIKELFKDAVDKGYLGRAKLDRLEHDPEPVRLTDKRSADEVRAVLSRRLEVFFAAAGVEPDAANPVAPYTSADLAPQYGLRARDVLRHFHEHREACVRAGAWVPPGGAVSPPVPPPVVSQTDFAKLWNDFLPTVKPPIVGEAKLAELLAWAVGAASDEMPPGLVFSADQAERFVQVEAQSGDAHDKLLVAVCDRSAKGGGLGNQIDETVERTDENIHAVFLRSTDFPKTPTADVVRQLAKLCKPVGPHRKYVVSDWRAMAAFREFVSQHGAKPGFAEWRRADQPLTGLTSLRNILDLDRRKAAAPKPLPPAPPLPPAGRAKDVPPPPPVTPPAPPPPMAVGPITFAATRGTPPAPVTIEPKALCRHAAFLGGPGSGKTTAALAIIEELLLRGVPAVLIDRKGDLARYADPTAWAEPEPDPDRAARRARLRAAVDVALYTPGGDRGRPLAIPVVPPDLGTATRADREQIAGYAAAGLARMMGYKGTGNDPKPVILQKAIEALAAAPGAAVGALQKLVRDQDDALLAQFDGQYEDKHFKALATDLMTLGIRHRRLLEGAETLDVDALLGRGAFAVAGKTRLTVVNTQALADPATADFWVSQLLVAVERWRVKTPSPDGSLQAVFLFDEADAYLPATTKPATKAPLEGLLKRARSAGIGLLLATQSPGDLDYRSRDQILTWLVGRVTQKVALDKLKPTFEPKPAALDKLAAQTTGEFYLAGEGGVTAVRAARNLIATAQLPEERVLELAAAR